LIPLDALAAEGAFSAPWPDIWIAAGRATLPLSTRVRRWSGGRTFVVQTQDPRTSAAAFDLIVPPEHDGLAGPRVFPILGAPNRVTPERLASELAPFAARLEALPHPRLAVIVGGKSKAFDLPAPHARRLAEQIAVAAAKAGGSVMVSYSRRTPEDAAVAMTEVFRGLPGTVWGGEGPNPYFAFLAAADAVLVTEESTNLATDAAVTGKPVYVLPLPGRSAKLARFHAELEARGVSRRFAGEIAHWSYAPLRETDRAAEELLRRYAAPRGAA
jgi:uncharacterized protein